jgi:hypothetical protein
MRHPVALKIRICNNNHNRDALTSTTSEREIVVREYIKTRLKPDIFPSGGDESNDVMDA